MPPQNSFRLGGAIRILNWIRANQNEAPPFFAVNRAGGIFYKLAKMPPIHSKYRKARPSYLVKIDTRKVRMFKRGIPKFGVVIGHSFIKNVKRYVEAKMAERNILDEVQSGARRLNSTTAEIMDLDRCSRVWSLNGHMYLTHSPGGRL